MSKVYIKEFLPNPVGKDTDGEYIKLFNEGVDDINLSGWKIVDASGKKFNLNGYTIKTNSELVLSYSATKISLNNNGETLFLYDSAGNLIDEVGYSGKAAEGIAYGKEIVLNEELRNEFLEDESQFAQLSNSVSGSGLTQLFVNLILTATVLSLIFIYVVKKLDADQKNSS